MKSNQKCSPHILTCVSCVKCHVRDQSPGRHDRFLMPAPSFTLLYRSHAGSNVCSRVGRERMEMKKRGKGAKSDIDFLATKREKMMPNVFKGSLPFFFF